MSPHSKSLFKKAFFNSHLKPLVHPLQNLYLFLQKHITRRVFSKASDTPPYLDISALEALQKKYPVVNKTDGYDPHSRAVRGTNYANLVLSMPGAFEAKSFLEIGGNDGMVSCALSREGKKTTDIDINASVFDERAADAGVNFVKMDAHHMQFEDESFDFVFSYNSFEHFKSPEEVLREATRVVKKGGHILLNFGPLYYSPWGEHAYRSISVPYCQFLWSKGMLNEFCEQKGLAPLDFSINNGWSVERYRELWNRYSKSLKVIRYNENLEISHLNLIRMFPSCFKSKSGCFENFIVTKIIVLFEKSGADLPENGLPRKLKTEFI